MNSEVSVTYRHITAEHYIENGKYMIWYHLEGKPNKTIGFIQVRGLKDFLTKEDLKKHIDKLWETYKKGKTDIPM